MDWAIWAHLQEEEAWKHCQVLSMVEAASCYVTGSFALHKMK